MSENIANGGVNRGPTYRVPRSGALDPATKRLALIAAGLGGALFVVLGAWSTLGGHSSVVPTIAAPAGPIRVKPENPGGLKVATNQIFSGRGLDSATDTLAPAPEAPDPQALKAPPAPAPRPRVIAQPAPAPAPAAPVAAKPAVAKAAAAPTHGMAVQFASLPTREAAETEWQRLTHRDANLLAGRVPSFTEATVNGRVWWRLRTGGFADEAQAREFCEKFRAGGAACTLARF